MLSPRRLLRMAACLVLGIALATSRPADAQKLPEIIEEVGADYAALYLQPLVNAFGADINSGLIHTAKVGGGTLPVDLFLGVKITSAFVPDIDRTLNITYETSYPFPAPDGKEYTLPVIFEINDGPTVFGEASPGEVTGRVRHTVHPGLDGMENTPDDIVIDSTIAFKVLPGLYDGPLAPVAIPHLSLGSVAGTEGVLRYFPRVRHANYGYLEFVGVGLRHSVDQYIPALPFRISGHFMMQRLLISNTNKDEILKASSVVAGGAISKTFVFLTLYGGMQAEETLVEVNYTFGDELSIAEGQNISFELAADTTIRGLLGVSLKLGPILLNVEGSRGNNRTVITAGVGAAL